MSFQEDLYNQLQSLDAEEKYELIINLAKNLPTFENLKNSVNLLQSCSSRVWLKITENQGKIEIQADSDSMIVKGVLFILYEVYNGKDLQQAKAEKLWILEHSDFLNLISSNRRSGISSILKLIDTFLKSTNNQVL